MNEDSEKFVVVRIKEATRLRLKIKAAQMNKKLYEIIDALL